MPPIIYQILYLRHSQKSSTLQKSSSKLMVDTSLVVLVMKAYHAFIMRGILLIPNSGYISYVNAITVVNEIDISTVFRIGRKECSGDVPRGRSLQSGHRRAHGVALKKVVSRLAANCQSSHRDGREKREQATA